MRVLIDGMARSGTTLVFSAIMQALPGAHAGVFEPSAENFQRIDTLIPSFADHLRRKNSS